MISVSQWAPRLRGLVFLLAAAAGLSAAQAEAPRPWPAGRAVAAQSWFDASGAATLEAARAAFAAGQGQAADGPDIMPLGQGGAAWYQLRLPPPATPVDVVFAVPFAGMDVVQLFRPDGTGGWRMQRSGDAIPVSQWPMRYLHPSFAITVAPGEARATYLRVQHSHPIGVTWKLWDAASFHEASKLWHLALGAGTGLMVLVVLLSIANAISWRDPIHLLYAGHVILVALSVMSVTGVAGEYLWPDRPWWNDIASVAIPGAALGWMGLLVRELVAERGQRLVSWLLWAHVAISALIVAGFLAWGRQNFFPGTNVYALVSLAFIIGVLVWYSRRRPTVGLWVLAGMGMLVAGSLFPVLRNLGVLSVSFATQYGPQLGGTLEVPLVLIGLYFRSRERRDNRLRMEALAHTDPLTGVANHRMLLERLQQLVHRSRRDSPGGAVLRVQVANLETIRGAYGRAAAEAAVVRAAECVASETAPADLVAREQGGDLVLVMEGKVSRAHAAGTARDIIARGLKFSGRLPAGVTLTLRVAGACAPWPARDPQELLATLGGQVQRLASDLTGRGLRILDGADQ